MINECHVKDCSSENQLLNVHPAICFFHARALGLIADGKLLVDKETGNWSIFIPTTFN